jgi:hypothetical protein
MEKICYAIVMSTRKL